MSSTANRVLTVHDVVRLSTLVEGVIRGARVRWLLDSGDVAEGTLRHFAPESGSAAHVPDSQDVRNAFVRVTTAGGFETWLAVAGILPMIAETTFVTE